jgi:hypothetical protein
MEDDDRQSWMIVPRFIVWLTFMASGVVVIPLSVAMCIAYFPSGLVIFLPWLDWAEGVHSWMLGRTSLLGAPIGSLPRSPADLNQQVEHRRRSRVCPVCDFECVTHGGPSSQCPNCTHLFDIERVETPAR